MAACATDETLLAGRIAMSVLPLCEPSDLHPCGIRTGTCVANDPKFGHATRANSFGMCFGECHRQPPNVPGAFNAICSVGLERTHAAR